MQTKLIRDTLTWRRAGREDAVQLNALFQSVYANSSHPFQSLADVEIFLEDDRNIEVIVEEGGEIVAGAAMTYCEWNDAYEFGRAITKSNFRRHGLAQFVMDGVIRATCDQRRGGVFFGFPRVRRIADVAATLSPAFVPVGHDGGRNIVDGRRELHLIVYAVPSYAEFDHVAPPAQLFKSAFLRESLYEFLRLSVRPGNYPEKNFVGPPPICEQRELGFVFDYDWNSPSRALEITEYIGESKNLSQVCDKLDQLCQSHREVEHQTVTVLADKIELIRALMERGFVVGAYLPAWYPLGGSRFDCVQLFRVRFSEEALVQGFADRVAVLRSELPRIYEPVNGHRRGFGDITQVTGGRRESIDRLTWRPEVFKWTNDSERHDCQELAQRRPGLQVFDTISSQLSDLIRSRHPRRRFSGPELQSLSEQHLAGLSKDEYGVWVYYPWCSRLVHLLDRAEFAELRTNRNQYKITPQEQAALAEKRIGVVGLSVGQSAALTLALERAFGEIRLADFDSIDLSNLNRLRSGIHNLGVPKVIVTAREILEIDPFLSITIFDEGITPDNCETFLTAGGPLDVVIEECDSLDVKCLVREAARRYRIPVVMETSDRGMLDIERFDLEPHRAIFHGLAGDLNPALIRGLTTEQKIPFVLRIIGEETISTRLGASLVEVNQTISSWPQLASAVSLGGGLAADAARRILLKKPLPSGRYFFDLEDLTISRAAPAATKLAPSRKLSAVAGQAQRAPAGALTLDRSTIQSLVEQACLAPSGGNSQPWIWTAHGPHLDLFLDADRTSGLVDFEFTGSYVALGTAAENLRLAAHHHGLEVCFEMFPSNEPMHVATIHFVEAATVNTEEHWRDDLFSRIPLRHTNRKYGNRRPLPSSTIDALSQAVRSIPGAGIQWLSDNDPLERISALVGAGDRIRMLHARLHQEMMKELRWSREQAEATRDGVDLDTLHLSQSDLAGLRVCRDWRVLEFLKELDLGEKLQSLSCKYMQSASAVGLITMPESRPRDYFSGGRALQRMWLVATEQNIAVHPMTVLPYLFACVERGKGDGFDSKTVASITALRGEYEKLFTVSRGAAEVLLFRISIANDVEMRSLRRRIEDVLHFC